MSAIEETHAAEGPGESTQGGIRPSVGDATRPMTLPQLPYGDAVHAELAEWELQPETMEAGADTLVPGGRRELVLRLVWPPGHDDLHPDVRRDGLTITWSHLTGWSARTTAGERLLDVEELAAPAAIAEYALHLAEDGLGYGWVPADTAARWEHADTLAADLAEFDERERRVKR